MKTISALILALVAANASAETNDQVLVTGAATKSGGAYSIDIESSGNVVVFQAFVHAEGVKASDFDLSSCLTGLPKGWGGKCEFINGRVVIVGLNAAMSPLPAGLQNVGSIKVRGAVKGLRVSDVELGSRDGLLSTKSTLSAE